jgi:Raf kinase inhibitor-like YbhB/YbcL family protein
VRRWVTRPAGLGGLLFVAVGILVLLHVDAGGSGFHLRSAAFKNGGAIPARYTCTGGDVSPPLSWSAGPSGTSAFAIVVTDPDAPGGTFTHWTVWDLPSKTRSLKAGANPPFQGENSFGSVGWRGPCPPAGPAHHYVFRIYALDKALHLARGTSFPALQQKLQAHAFLAARLVGTFARS